MWDEYVKRWWLISLRGMLSILVGLMLIASPVKSVVVITTLVGLYMLIEGVIVMVASLFHIKKDDDWWVFFFQGLVTLLIGILVFALPQVTLAALLFLVAIWIFVVGIAMLFQAFRERKEVYGGEWLMTAGSIVLLLIAFFLFSNPETTIQITAVLIGVVMLISGIFTTAMGFQVKGFDRKVKKVARKSSSKSK